VTKKKVELAVWQPVKRVRLNTSGKLKIGSGIFGTSDFTESKTYDVIGMAFETYPDGSRELCYILKDDTGTVALRSTSRFEVVEDEHDATDDLPKHEEDQRDYGMEKGEPID